MLDRPKVLTLDHGKLNVILSVFLFFKFYFYRKTVHFFLLFSSTGSSLLRSLSLAAVNGLLIAAGSLGTACGSRAHGLSSLMHGLRGH